MRKRDLTGLVFGRLTVLREAPPEMLPNGQSRTCWLCRCHCGNEKVAKAHLLVRGTTKSCGCLNRENAVAVGHKNSIHNLTRTPTYVTWQAMRARCFNPKARGYDRYGGRGITVCDRWNSSFAAFLEDMGVRPGKNYQIDRIDSDGNYEPGNCRWVTASQNTRNRPTMMRLITVGGVTKQLCEWADEFGVDRNSLGKRLKRGQSFEDAIKELRAPVLSATG